MNGRSTPEITALSSIDALGTEAALVVPFFDGDDASTLQRLSGRDEGSLRALLERGAAPSKRYEMTLLYDVGAASTLLLGCGPREEMEPVLAMRLASAASRHLARRGFRRIGYLHRGFMEPRVWAQAVTQGALAGPYDPGLKKSRDLDSGHLDRIDLVTTADQGAVEAGARLGQIVGEATNLARDLVNLPANDLTPTTFAGRAREVAEEAGLRHEILDEGAMRDLGMGSFLGVSAGSDEPAKLIVLRYGSDDSPVRLALVGKGLTFDSGGLSLKTAEGMETMKGDMGGGAAVVAGMQAVARLAPTNIAVTGYVGATENMPSGKSMRPGDVLTAMNGKTIEVLNTDAEGRLVLADVLAYACRQGATHIVDFATLTGGAVVALGHAATLAAGEPQQWVQQVVEAASEGLERAWAMPLYEEYRRAMDSDVADIKNTGGRYGSALTATAFLRDFVDGPPWAHMDIAGTAWADKAAPYQSTGGTGAGVGTIAALVQRLAAGPGR